MTQTITDQRRPNELRPHPMNEEVYGDRADADLIESVRTKGVLNPVLITADNLIISGHRRWGAAIAAGLTTIPVVITPIDDPLAIEEALIESNRQRQKTNEQIGREYKRLKHIYNERQSRQGQRTDLTSGSQEPEVKPTERAAAELGVSKATAVRIETVVDHIDQLQHNGHRDQADQLRQQLNHSAKTAYNTVRTAVQPTTTYQSEVLAPPAPRQLTPTEIEAVIWRAIQHAGHTTPANQLAWLAQTTVADYRPLLNPGVTLNHDYDLFYRQLDIVRDQLQRQINAAAPAQPAPRPITETLDNAIRRATCVYAGDETRWQEKRMAGATDQEIKAILERTFTSTGASSGPGLYYAEHMRGPRIKISKDIGDAEPLIMASGIDLINLVRRAWAIPHRIAEKTPPPPTLAESTAPAAEPVEATPIEAEPTDEETDSDEYYTPPYIAAAAIKVLGAIDLDPASSDLAQTVIQARHYYTKADDGLTKEWHGRLWLNPPYSRPAPFVEKLLGEYNAGRTNAAILLVNNGTETKWGQSLLRTGFPVCFIGAHEGRGSRISFWRRSPDEPRNGNRYAQMIAYLGPNPAHFAVVFAQFGTIIAAQ